MANLVTHAWTAAREIPRSIALPAVGAAAAYLNGRYNFANDLNSLRMLIRFDRMIARFEKQDNLNVFYRLEELAQSPEFANRTFLVLPKDTVSAGAQTEWTYAQAYEMVLRYAAWLHHVHGVKKDEIVALDCLNKPVFIWAWFATWSLGALPAFINTSLRGNAFVHCVQTSTARLLLLDGELEEPLKNEITDSLAVATEGQHTALKIAILNNTLEQQLLVGAVYRAPNEVRSTTVSSAAQLIFTSGTTGLPKAAKVDWRKPVSGIAVWPEAMGLNRDDRFFTAMPLYHSSACNLAVCSALGARCAVVIAPKFSPNKFIKQAAETGATGMQYIGELCRYLVTVPPSPYDKAHNMRVAFGNGLRPDVWQKFKDRYGIVRILEFYGSTEGPGATWNISNNTFTNGAIGQGGLILQLLSASTTAIIEYDHEDDTPVRNPKTGFCSRVAPDETGEVIFALDPANVESKFQGYYGNNKATSSKILRDVFKKGDVWYRSGDLFRRDSEGRTWFMDRIGDTFRWKGENVSTNEVAEALGAHPDLKEANVYGVQLPGHDGRAGCAALILAEGKTMDGALRRSLAAHVQQRLPRYALPIFLRVVREFEVTGTNKQTKVALRNESVEPSKMGDDQVFWLRPGSDAYVPFGSKEWTDLTAGSVKL